MMTVADSGCTSPCRVWARASRTQPCQPRPRWAALPAWLQTLALGLPPGPHRPGPAQTEPATARACRCAARNPVRVVALTPLPITTLGAAQQPPRLLRAPSSSGRVLIRV